MEKLDDILAPAREPPERSGSERARLRVSAERAPKQPDARATVRIRSVVEHRRVKVAAAGRRADPAWPLLREAESVVVAARVRLEVAVRDMRDARIAAREGDFHRALAGVDGRRRVRRGRVLGGQSEICE